MKNKYWNIMQAIVRIDFNWSSDDIKSHLVDPKQLQVSKHDFKKWSIHTTILDMNKHLNEWSGGGPHGIFWGIEIGQNWAKLAAMKHLLVLKL